MFIPIGTPKSIKELSIPNYALKTNQRLEIPIMVIDDEGFNYLENLKTNSFNIKHYPDINAIEDVLSYEIILCDIKGVGKKFGSKFEGAHLISEIRKKYPFKTIIAYTAHQSDPTYNRFFKDADYVFKKDLDNDEWLEKLDEAIENSTNLIHRWKKIRNYLIDRDISLFHITMLEDEYVKLLQGGKDVSEFPKEKLKKKFPQDVRGVLQSFTASILFKLIIGS